MRLAVMQPYFFPYIGYFQLINAVDKFVFYDDVSFIKNGWINRNRILINGKPSYFTVQLKNASSNKFINEVEIADNRPKLLKTIQMAYKKAPFYEDVFPIILECIEYKTQHAGQLASFTVKRVSEYLNIDTIFENSSEKYGDTVGLNKAARLIEICKKNEATVYVNPIGGQELYQKNTFLEGNIELQFVKTIFMEYEQFKNEFIPGLSIIDIMMFNSPANIREMLNDYELE